MKLTKAKCKYCGKDIIYLTNRETGKSGPVDARPAVVYRPTGETQGTQQMAEMVGGVHISHWITCPERAQAAAARDAKKGAG